MARARDIYQMNQRRPLWLRLREAGKASPRLLQQRFRVRVPPVPILEIARDLDVAVWDQPNLGWQAFARADPNAANIWLRPGLASTEVRWWVSHMLGHIILDPLPLEQQASLATENWADPELTCAAASNWAWDLLAPDWLLRPPVLSGYPPDRLASLFQVNSAMMEDRLRALYPRWFG